MISSLLQDLRYSLRQILRSPVFAVAAIATLGLGIGATTAIFSVVNGLLLRQPPGVVDFGGLVSIYTSDYSGPLYGSSSLADLRDFESQASALSGVVGYSIAPVVVSGGTGSAGSEMILGQVVTPRYFELLGTRAAVGRLFASGEGEPGGPSDVVVLGHGLWRSRFGGDPDIVGERITLAGATYSVVGVAEEGFRGLLPAIASEFFVPVGAPGISASDVERRGSRSFFTVGRLEEGATIEQARTQLEAVAAGLFEQYPDAWTDVRGRSRVLTLMPARETIVPPQVRGPAFGFAALLMAIVAGVLLIGCANIANLLLARATGRRRELGIRLAIGARRGRIIRQLLTESMVLAAFGALLGVVIASAGTRALALATTALPVPFTLRVDIAPDLRVLGFAAAVTIVAGMLSGLAPAVLATRRNLVSTLHREDTGGRRLGLRAVLAAGQIAIAMLLLSAGGLLVRSLIAAVAVDPGFRTEGLLSVNLAFDETSTTAERSNVPNEILERVQALPGVTSASYASTLPLGHGEGRRGFRPEGYAPTEGEDLEINSSHAGPGFFGAIGTSLVSGREFDATDRPGSPPVAIVNEAFVRRFFAAGSDPLGTRLLTGGEPLTIIGVVQDGKYVSLDEDPLPFVWRAAEQWSQPLMSVVVRGEGNVNALAQPIREVVADVAPDAAITGVAIDNQHLSFTLLPQRTAAWLLGLFGVLGLALAALGVYGVMAYTANQRTREFGIRLALGARPGDITGMVVRQGMSVCGIGMTIGIVLAFGVTRFMRFLLFGVNPLDPTTFVGVAILVSVVALLANWLPARRSAGASPLESLRFD